MRSASAPPLAGHPRHSAVSLSRDARLAVDGHGGELSLTHAIGGLGGGGGGSCLFPHCASESRAADNKRSFTAGSLALRFVPPERESMALL